MTFEERMQKLKDERKAAEQARIHDNFLAARQSHLLRLQLDETWKIINELMPKSGEKPLRLDP